jgi:hypothetical protein
MNADAPLSFKADLPLWSLATLGVFLAGLFVVIAAIRRSPSAGQAIAKLAAMIVAVIVAGAVLYFVRKTDSPLARVLHQNTATVAESPLPDRAGPLSVNNEADSAKLDAERPEWTRQSSQAEGANKLVVVRSGRFATPEEAELHALDEALKVAAQQFRHLDPSGVGRSVPAQRELVREAIQERHEETSRHDLGTMKDFPMHQVWLQVKLSPQLGERFAAPWRQAAVDGRLRALAGWSIWGTAASGLIAFALRLDSSWNGRRRVVVVGTTAALVLGGLAFVA